MTDTLTIEAPSPADTVPGEPKPAVVLVVDDGQTVMRLPLTKREALQICRDIIRGLE